MHRPGGRSRITPTRPHPLCRTCQRFAYGADTGPDALRPALVDSDGVATCPNLIHAGSVMPAAAARNPADAGMGGNTA